MSSVFSLFGFHTASVAEEVRATASEDGINLGTFHARVVPKRSIDGMQVQPPRRNNNPLFSLKVLNGKNQTMRAEEPRQSMRRSFRVPAVLARKRGGKEDHPEQSSQRTASVESSGNPPQ